MNWCEITEVLKYYISHNDKKNTVGFPLYHAERKKPKKISRRILSKIFNIGN